MGAPYIYIYIYDISHLRVNVQQKKSALTSFLSNQYLSPSVLVTEKEDYISVRVNKEVFCIRNKPPGLHSPCPLIPLYVSLQHVSAIICV